MPLGRGLGLGEMFFFPTIKLSSSSGSKECKAQKLIEGKGRFITRKEKKRKTST
jgi:hypothetical protein